MLILNVLFPVIYQLTTFLINVKHQESEPLSLFQAWYLPLLLLTVPSGATPPDMAAAVLPSASSLILSSAAAVLRTLHRTLKNAGGPVPNTRQLVARGLLGNILPEPLLQALEDPEHGPERFAEMAVTDIERPGVSLVESCLGKSGGHLHH